MPITATGLILISMHFTHVLQSIPWFQLLGCASAVCGDILLLKRNILTWPVGITYNIVAIGVFFSGGIYADGCLQLLFLGLALWGWYTWHTASVPESPSIASKPAAKITSLTRREAYIVVIAICILWPAIYFILSSYTNSTVPTTDSLSTALSLVALWCQGRKKWQNWLIWALVDVVNFFMLWYKKFYPLALLNIFFIGIVIAGTYFWYRSYRESVEVSAVRR